MKFWFVVVLNHLEDQNPISHCDWISDKGGRSLIREARVQWQERLQPLINGSTYNLHLRNYDFSLKDRVIFSRDNSHGKMLTTVCGTFETMDFMSTNIACTRWGLLWHRESHPVPLVRFVVVGLKPIIHLWDLGL